MILTPTQMRNIYKLNGGDGSYETWTQIHKLVEWPPADTAVFFFFKGTVLCGCSAVDKGKLDTWRRKYSVRRIPKSAHSEDREWKRTDKYDEWYELYKQGYKQSEIAKMLGVSASYCSIIKKRMCVEKLDIA